MPRSPNERIDRRFYRERRDRAGRMTFPQIFIGNPCRWLRWLYALTARVLDAMLAGKGLS